MQSEVDPTGRVTSLGPSTSTQRGSSDSFIHADKLFDKDQAMQHRYARSCLRMHQQQNSRLGKFTRVGR